MFGCSFDFFQFSQAVLCRYAGCGKGQIVVVEEQIDDFDNLADCGGRGGSCRVRFLDVHSSFFHFLRRSYVSMRVVARVMLLCLRSRIAAGFVDELAKPLR